jgi:hypothetical protein
VWAWCGLDESMWGSMLKFPATLEPSNTTKVEALYLQICEV